MKLADLGFACKSAAQDGTGLNQSMVGTPGYAAPGIFKDQPYQGHIADLFSFGVILFMLYSGRPPFAFASQSDPHYNLIQSNKSEDFWKRHQNVKPTGFYSKSFISLISALFMADPEQRPSIDEIRKHPWFKKGKNF